MRRRRNKLHAVPLSKEGLAEVKRLASMQAMEGDAAGLGEEDFEDGMRKNAADRDAADDDGLGGGLEHACVAHFPPHSLAECLSLLVDARVGSSFRTSCQPTRSLTSRSSAPMSKSASRGNETLFCGCGSCFSFCFFPPRLPAIDEEKGGQLGAANQQPKSERLEDRKATSGGERLFCALFCNVESPPLKPLAFNADGIARPHPLR